MIRHVLHTRLSREEIRRQIALVPAMIAGKAADRHGIARGFKLRLAVAWLARVKEAFIVKARGGTDAAGISWPALTAEYLAYGRGPFSTRRAGKQAPGKVRGGPRDGQQNDGFLSPAQMKHWRAIYAANLKWLAARHGLEDAKGHAAAIAWAQLKREGAKTKLQVFGTRTVDILRDRGLLFNSLSPGILTESGAGASYSPPYAQVVKDGPGDLLVGTNVAYAAAHHNGKRKDHSVKGKGAIRRQLWPEPDQVPAAWLEDMAEAASSGIPIVMQMIADGGLS